MTYQLHCCAKSTDNTAGTALIHHIQSLNVKRDFGFEMTSTYNLMHLNLIQEFQFKIETFAEKKF